MSNTLLTILIIAGVAIYLICLNELRSYKRNQKETNRIISEAYNRANNLHKELEDGNR